MSFNLAVILRESAKRHPDGAALVHDGGRLSYRDLDVQSDRVAAELLALGLKPGGAVGLQLPNVPEFVVAMYGVLKAGGAVMPLNPLNMGPEIEYFLRSSGADFLLTDSACAAEAAKGFEATDARHLFVRGDGDLPEGARRLEELLDAEGHRPATFVPTEPQDTAVLLFTSGTTGRPKGVRLTHFQLYMNAQAHQQAFRMGHTTVTVAVMPLFHALGLSGILNATLGAGGTVRLLPKFDPTRVLEVVEQDRATLLHGVPTMYHALLHHPELDRFDTSSLNTCGSAGAAIPADLIDEIERVLGVEILEMYGLTESGPLATANVPGERKPYSIGKPIWGTEIQIWDGDGNPRPPGAANVGEIVIRGHNTMGGYLDDPEATEEAFKGGWLHSGDLGYQDEDGFLFIVGRKKDLIIRGGYNVYPREVEEVLHQHPDVAEVAVLGVPDQRLGEEIAAYATLRAGATLTPQELIDFARARVAAYKYPRSVTFLETLPKGPTGKILRHQLLETAHAEGRVPADAR